MTWRKRAKAVALSKAKNNINKSKAADDKSLQEQSSFDIKIPKQ
jgi:hypothetical protein